jgi:hypothetical protein
MSILGTPGERAFLPTRDRHIYVLWIALVWAGMIAGFLPDLNRYMAEAPPPPLILQSEILPGTTFAIALFWILCEPER